MSTVKAQTGARERVVQLLRSLFVLTIKTYQTLGIIHIHSVFCSVPVLSEFYQENGAE